MKNFQCKVWDKKHKKMIRPNALIFNLGNHEINNIRYGKPMNISDMPFLTEDDFEFLFYTGFKDNKNKLIFDGDICNVRDMGRDDWSHGVVHFDKGCFWVDESPMYEIQEFEIVGNIYENSKLIK